jgi:hypothetical protein
MSSTTPLSSRTAVPPPRTGKYDASWDEETVTLHVRRADAVSKAGSHSFPDTPSSTRPFILRTGHTLVFTACLCFSCEILGSYLGLYDELNMLILLRSLVYWTFLHSLLPTKPLSNAYGSNAPSWHQYVRAPSSRTVPPKAILSQYTKGNVTNAGALVNGGGGLTALTRTSSASEVPTVVIDFGQNIVGLLEIGFAGSTSYATPGYPGLKLSFSETLEFLTNRSDFTRSDNGGGVCCIHMRREAKC